MFIILNVHLWTDETIERILSQVGPLAKWTLNGFVLFRSIFFIVDRLVIVIVGFIRDAFEISQAFIIIMKPYNIFV